MIFKKINISKSRILLIFHRFIKQSQVNWYTVNLFINSEFFLYVIKISLLYLSVVSTIHALYIIKVLNINILSNQIVLINFSGICFLISYFLNKFFCPKEIQDFKTYENYLDFFNKIYSKKSAELDFAAYYRKYFLENIGGDNFLKYLSNFEKNSYSKKLKKRVKNFTSINL